MEQRLDVDLIAWRLDDGPIGLGPVRILRRSVSPGELEQAQAAFVAFSIVTIDVQRRMVGPGEEPLADAATSRWEFDDSFSFGRADDADLRAIAEVMACQESARTKRELVVLAGPVTPESFYHDSYWSHAQAPDKVSDGTTNKQPAGLAEKVDEAENRLGVTFPPMLRQLYELQNGGYVNNPCVPDPEVENHRFYSHIKCHPFEVYSELRPTENLITAYESFLDFGDPDDELYDSYFRLGVEKMVVLAQYYNRMLFLDYREPERVRVAMTDFDNEDWPERIISWESFDDFFAALRHYEDF